MDCFAKEHLVCRQKREGESGQFCLRTLCRVLKVSPSEFYGWLERPPSACAQVNAVLLEHIHVAHVASDATYGVPHIQTEQGLVGDHAAPDLVQRTFTAPSINQFWVVDMTYIPTWQGLVYLALVLGVYSCKVVCWAFGKRCKQIGGAPPWAV